MRIRATIEPMLPGKSGVTHYRLAPAPDVTVRELTLFHLNVVETMGKALVIEIREGEDDSG